MLMKCFEEATLGAIETAVNVWLTAEQVYCYSNSFNMVPDGGGGENYCLMIFYI